MYKIILTLLFVTILGCAQTGPKYECMDITDPDQCEEFVHQERYEYYRCMAFAHEVCTVADRCSSYGYEDCIEHYGTDYCVGVISEEGDVDQCLYDLHTFYYTCEEDYPPDRCENVHFNRAID